VKPNPESKIKNIFEKNHADSDRITQVKSARTKEDPSVDPGQPTEWFECGQTSSSQAQNFETSQSNEHFTISATKMTALEGYNYCADLVQYPEISDPGILYTNTAAIDYCMFETLKEFSSLRSTDPAGTPVYPMAAFLGGYYNSQSDSPSWRWLNQDEIPPIGADPSVGYENWKQQNSGDQDRCILSALINPDQSGNTPNGTFENDYGWYTVDCNIKQYVVCKDCAYGYYFLNGCYRSCNVEDAPYDFWEITCADDVDEWNCKFGLADDDDTDVFDSFYGTNDSNVFDMSADEVGSGTGDFHNCMRFGQDWDVTQSRT
jgi:hypothetical protein